MGGHKAHEGEALVEWVAFVRDTDAMPGDIARCVP